MVTNLKSTKTSVYTNRETLRKVGETNGKQGKPGESIGNQWKTWAKIGETGGNQGKPGKTR